MAVIPGSAFGPSGDTAYSPGSGIVVAVQPSGHAFGLVLDGGIEVLIHIGIDTVALKGQGFDVKVTKGVHEYGATHGKVFYESNKTRLKCAVPVDWTL